MIQVIIRKPVWKDRSVSIRKELIDIALQRKEWLEVNIKAKPYSDFIYAIDPKKVIEYSKEWVIKGTVLLNFPISLMDKELKPLKTV